MSALMGTRFLLPLALGVAGIVAACGEAEIGSEQSRRRSGAPPADPTASATPPTPTASGGLLPTSDTAPAPDTEGKRFFIANLHPSLVGTCASCHTTGPGPVWISATDVEGSYKMQFQLGYVALDSRILLKGPHQGGPG